jgi:hypothetical protein
MSELIPGIEFNFGGGRKYLVPPLALGALERLQDRITKLNAATNALEPEAIATVIDASLAALKRNYPELKREDVAEMVDVGNMLDLIGCVLDTAGIKRKGIEAETAAKNLTAQPVTETPPLTGQGS